MQQPIFALDTRHIDRSRSVLLRFLLLLLLLFLSPDPLLFCEDIALPLDHIEILHLFGPPLGPERVRFHILLHPMA